jgi:hypothetical protein
MSGELIHIERHLAILLISVRHCRQDRQCTYNVTLRIVRVTTVTLEKQQVLHRVCARTCAHNLS